jgi:hypothetical protein
LSRAGIAILLMTFGFAEDGIQWLVSLVKRQR